MKDHPTAARSGADENTSRTSARSLRATRHLLFIVGLDKHTGFVVNDGEDLAFIHSSYFDPPFAVTAEPVTGPNPLAQSKYRVFGKILGDDMIRKWILGEKFEMK